MDAVRCVSRKNLAGKRRSKKTVEHYVTLMAFLKKSENHVSADNKICKYLINLLKLKGKLTVEKSVENVNNSL